MNLLSLFTREELVAGLEISDNFLRLALLKKSKIPAPKIVKIPTTKAAKVPLPTEKSENQQDVSTAPISVENKKEVPILEKTEVVFLIEEPLEAGIIKDGIVINKESLAKSLKELFKKTNPKVKFAVVSIPAEHAYFKIFSFPKTIQEERLEETMKLTIGFQLPVVPEQVYLDWEKTEGQNQNEVFLTTMPKPVANSYIEALNLAGLRIVAVEISPLSALRSVEIKENSQFVLKIPSLSGVGIYFVKNGKIWFARFLPEKFINKKSFDDESKKLSDFFEFTGESIGDPIDNIGPKSIEWIELDKLKISNQMATLGESRLNERTDSSKWLVSLGAALRGLMPRHEDNLISLMPVGTEEAYEYQKMATFAEFISSISIGLSIFFSAAFLIAWIFISSIQQQTSKQIENLTALPVPEDAAILEEQTKELNDALSVSTSLINTMPKWSAVLDELKGRVISDIIIVNLSLPSPSDIFGVNGIAKNRSQLNLFKKSLEGSEMFMDINLPLANLEQKENIPFSISFRLKNPKIIYEY